MTKNMPDIACQPHQTAQGTLNWVGMSGIETPIQITTLDGQKEISSKAQAYVSLDDPFSKGIHMSRLYQLLDELTAKAPLTPASVEHLLQAFIQSHQGLSQNALVEFNFDYYERRASLKSDNAGWKHYPTRVRGEIRDGHFQCEIALTVPYSSTCPCSAALSRQIIQDSFKKQFSDKPLDMTDILNWLGTPEGISATPHSQRSYAQIKLTVATTDNLNLSHIINIIEDAVQTPVQAMVKREDEQEFARLNASNLMFCEDAARRIQTHLNQHSEFKDYWFRINHLESLHPHDAVAIVTKGIPNGYPDEPNLMDAL